MSMGIGFDVFQQGTPSEQNTGDPSGYGNSRTGGSNKHALIVGTIVIAAILLLLLGVVGLRVSGEVVI